MGQPSLTTTPDHNGIGQRSIEPDRKEVQAQASDGNRQRERTLQPGGLDGSSSVKPRLTLKRWSQRAVYAELAGPATGQKRRSCRGKPGQPETMRGSPTSMHVSAAQARDGHDRSSKLVMRLSG